MSNSSPLRIAHQKEKTSGWLFHTIVPSIMKAVILRSLLFLALFVGGLIWMLGSVVSPHPGSFLVASIVAIAINYLACSLISSTLLNFGWELRDFSLFGVAKLWPLALRILWIPLVAAVVLAPVLASWLVKVLETPLSHPALLAFNLGLLHVAFIMGSAFVTIIPATHKVTRFMAQAAFPFRFLSKVGLMSFWLLFIIIQALRATWKAWQDVFVRVTDQVAAGADALLQITVLGPAVLFWLNPYYLLFRLHASADFPVMAPIAFSLVCIIAIVAMTLRLRYWLTIDLDERSAEVYDAWIQFRGEIPLEQEQTATTVTENRPFAAEPEAESGLAEAVAESVPTLDNHLVKTVQQEYFKLPSAISPEVYLIEAAGTVPVYPGRKGLALVFLTALSAVFLSKWMVMISMGLWVILTIANRWPVLSGTWIAPQRIWPIVGWVVRRRLMPLLGPDFLFAVVVTAVFQLDAHNCVPIWLLLALFRLLVLNLEISYVHQALKTFLLGILCGIVYLFVAIAGVKIKADPGETMLLWTLLAIAAGSLLLAWVVLAITLQRVFGNLHHRKLPT